MALKWHFTKFIDAPQKIFTSILFISILLLAFWIRIQGNTRIPTQQFTEHDAYLYYYQARIIAEEGILPERDMHRWLPLGRDNTQILSLYAYAIAYLHKILGGSVSLHQIQLYLPTFSFLIGLTALLLFLTRTYNIRFATIVGVLLATLPGSIERSAVGFGDRDAWCLMLGIITIISYLWKAQMQPGYRRYLVTAASGLTAFLGGLSWEGFGIFLLIIHATELWIFCTEHKVFHFKEYMLWMFMFIPGLFFISPAYHNGYGFSKHVTALMLTPTIVILMMHTIKYLMLRFKPTLQKHAQKIACTLTLSAITLGIVYVGIQANTFETTAFALRESKFMKKVAELKDPTFIYWISRYGTIFILSCFGLVVTSIKAWKLKSLTLVVSLILYVGTTFFREFVNEWTSPQICNTLLLISFAGIVTGFAIITFLQRNKLENDSMILAMYAWFLLWGTLSRSGIRYDFFTGVAFAFFTTKLIQFVANAFSMSLREKIQPIVKTSIAILILTAFMFLPVFGAYTKRTLYAATQMRKVVPENNLMTAYKWIKKELPKTAVIAAKWDYGTQLNVFSNVKTFTDPDHYIPYWIELYEEYVYHATSQRVFLEFLKTHNTTHLMLTHNEITTNPILQQNNTDTLVPVYPTENFTYAPIKVWEIRYPDDIQPNPKYLATDLKDTP